VYKSVPYGDIEGVWTYIYFSYNGKTSTAVGLIKYAGEEFKRVEIPAKHEQPTFLRFILGGNDVKSVWLLNIAFSLVNTQDSMDSSLDRLSKSVQDHF
jgi:hypothetical protein